MIALDTSSLIAYLSGARGLDVTAVETALEQKQAVLPSVVLSELLSDPKLSPAVAQVLKELPLLPIIDGFWERVGHLRAETIRRGHKASLADSLIAQTCMDHQVSLISRDSDFRHFVRRGGLTILP
ncbi:MAG: type II toxin-antitoxin system VapC family toxin [Candidatus Binatia bacterium]